MLAVMDCIHLLFQGNTVVLYKLHPMREYHEGFVKKLFKPLIDKGSDAQPCVPYPALFPALCALHSLAAFLCHVLREGMLCRMAG